MSGESQPPIGQRYVVLERLGRGGTGVVYRVRDRSGSHDVALKQLVRAGDDRDEHAAALFEREFQVLAQLRHPSVIEVYDYGIDQAGPFYTMELLDGGDLSELAPLPFAPACQLMMQVCSSLSLLHSRRLVHRDVSPRNVRRTRAGGAKLIDFGAMVPMGPCRHSVGTPAFVAPEVVHHLTLDARTDLFSIGATLYFALTGRRAFAARTMDELREAWRIEPTPPGRIVADIPPALDELVMSLLRIDPDRRPRSAFEVMQRLAAAAGVANPESQEISASYLATPMLVGRESAQRRFRQAVRRSRDREGGALLFQGASGMGRSRLLDVCMLEGKTAGATVLRVEGDSVRHEPFASAHSLAEQLARATPDTLQDDLGDSRSFAREHLAADPYAAQAMLLGWFRAASQWRLLMIAVDDLERIDDASLALLVALVNAAHGGRVLLVATLPDVLPEQAHQALSVLCGHHAPFVLPPLRAEETEAMFASIFFDAPHVALVSHRIHQLAAGRPREAMALARHLVSSGRVRYADGNWVLPGEMALADLPASAEDALRARISRLSPLARRLVEAQALALDSAWTRDDYLALEPSAAGELDAALEALVEEGVLAQHGATYTLSRLGAAHALVAELSPADAIERHRALAAQCVQRGRPLLFEVHHRLSAGEHVPALQRLRPVLQPGATATTFADVAGLSRKTMGEILERAQQAAVRCARPLREINELRRVLVEISATSDNVLFDRYGGTWLAQIELDSGLCDYRARSQEPPQVRLAHALEAARARSAALPEAERVYGIDEAIRHLARYTMFAMVSAVNANDAALLASLPEKLAPFSAAIPAAHAIEQTLTAQGEMGQGKLEQGRLRYRAAYERLQNLSSSELGYLETIRHSVAYGVAFAEVRLGYPSALHWIEIAEQTPLHSVNARWLRRALCIFEGDVEGAERHRRDAEMMGAQAISRQVHHPPFPIELSAQLHAGDLAAIKLLADRTGRLIAAAPGWLPWHHTALGHYQRLRGDPQAAKRELETALHLFDPDRSGARPTLRMWVIAIAGYIQVLVELGEYEQACRFGADALARCEAREITDGWTHIRALAIAEAKAGRYADAARRLDRLLTQYRDRNPAHLAPDLEARALVAIWSGDRAGASHFAELATRHEGPERNPLQLARRGRLLDEATKAGIQLELTASSFESVVFTPNPRADAPVLDAKLMVAIEALRDPQTRAARALALLCDATGAPSGHLYARQGDALVRSASRGAPPDEALDRFAEAYVDHQVEQAAMSTVFTVTEPVAATLPIANWHNPQGVTYSVTLLKRGDRDQYFGAVALRAPPESLRSREFTALVWAVSARLLALG